MWVFFVHTKSCNLFSDKMKKKKHIHLFHSNNGKLVVCSLHLKLRSSPKNFGSTASACIVGSGAWNVFQLLLYYIYFSMIFPTKIYLNFFHKVGWQLNFSRLSFWTKSTISSRYILYPWKNLHQIYALSQVQQRKGRNFQIAYFCFDFCWTSTYFKVYRLSRQTYTDLRNQNILIWLVFMKTFTPLQKNHINI